MKQKTNIEAENAVRDAMIEHGSPNWIAYVPMSVRKILPPGRIAELRDDLARSRKRVDTPTALAEWAAERHGQTATTLEMAEAVGVSRSVALKAIENRPDVFLKRGRSKYELRDAAKDRAEARTTTKKQGEDQMENKI